MSSMNGSQGEPDLTELIKSAVTQALKEAYAERTAYLVLLDDGQVMSGHFDREHAEQKAGHVEGVVVAVPIIADHRAT